MTTLLNSEVRSQIGPFQPQHLHLPCCLPTCATQSGSRSWVMDLRDRATSGLIGLKVSGDSMQIPAHVFTLVTREEDKQRHPAYRPFKVERLLNIRTVKGGKG